MCDNTKNNITCPICKSPVEVLAVFTNGNRPLSKSVGCSNLDCTTKGIHRSKQLPDDSTLINMWLSINNACNR